MTVRAVRMSKAIEKRPFSEPTQVSKGCPRLTVAVRGIAPSP